jgi:hypothetical protein
MDTTGAIDEALDRIHQRGPEFEGWLTNHAPMAAESLAIRDRGPDIHRWLDLYESRLEEYPDRHEPVTEDNWRTALGDPLRLTDWADYFARELADHPWREVLATWWPRLLPGLFGGATHTVIRVGHAVRLLTADESAGQGDGPRRTELAQALGYWAARFLPPPAIRFGPGPAGADAALDAVAPLDSRTGGYRARVASISGLPRWTPPVSGPEEVPARLTELVRAATHRYATHAHGNPVMLVHSATAPNAVLRTLPALPRELWETSLAAAWQAAAGVTTLYTPEEAVPYAPPGDITAEEIFQRALEHGDEHVIKFADTALDVGGERALAAALRAIDLGTPLREQ